MLAQRTRRPTWLPVLATAVLILASPAPRGRAASRGLKVLQARLVRNGNLIGSTLSFGADVVNVEIADDTGVDDTIRLYVEVRWTGGSSCEAWDLRLEIGSPVVREGMVSRSLEPHADALLQRGEIVLNNVPDNAQVYVKVSVDQAVSEADDL